MSAGRSLSRSTRGITATASEITAAVAGADISATEIAFINGVTAGTALADKAVVLNASKGITTITSATITTLTSTTVASAALTGTTTLTMTSANASALAVGSAGATNPAFVVDSSTGSQAAGLKITGAATGGTVAVACIDSGAAANLTINAKGIGTIGIGSVSTGIVTVTPALAASSTITGTSASASALAVGRLGATTPAFVVDASAGTQVAGLSVAGAATGGTVAIAAIDSGAAANLTINAKGAGTIGIGSVSTGAVTITPALTPAGGIASPVALTKVAKATGYHTCEQPAFASTVGTDTSNTNTEAYIGAVTIPGNVSSTGASVLNGSAVAGNVKYYLFNSDGTAALAATASTAQSGTDAYQRIAWVGGPIALVGPATYYIAWTGDTTGATQKINQINFGEGPAWKETALTYGTLATITPVTTFTADRAPYATLY